MKRCALITSLWKKWVHHIIPANQKLMRYGDLKFHIAEVQRCQKHTQTKSVPPVLFLENLWENETLQLKPGDRQLGSTKNNIDTHTFDVCLFPASASVSPWSPTTSYSRTPTGFPDSPCPYPQEIFFRGTWRLIEMAKWVLAEPTTDTASAWDEVISSCRITLTLFSDIPWNSMSINWWIYMPKSLNTYSL